MKEITDIRTENPFWLMKNGYLEVYPSLDSDIRTGVVIIGGGISGALLARNLVRAGAEVTVVERRHVAMGSTAASTALLQYDIDVFLHELIEKMGEEKAARAYELSLKALNDLEDICGKLKIFAEFEKRSSLMFAKRKKDFKALEKEFAARQKYGFDVELWDAAQVEKNFPFTAPGALFTKPSAIADPYKLAHGALQYAMSKGARVFDKTEIKRIERGPRSVTLHTASGFRISARKVVIACGYESLNYLPVKVGRLNSTYAFITEPVAREKHEDIWFENCTFWDTGDPYNYGRTTADNRIIFGGGDEPFYDPAKRDKLLPQKIAMLEKQFLKLFPYRKARTDYSWAGTFITTNDGLPYIGTLPKLAHTYFALGYGGNGITFSQMAADILTDLLLGKKNKDAEIFSFERETD